MSPSLGQRLKRAREKLGLSLADVSHRTRIPVQRLNDLEEDSYTSFGSLTYARSFLQAYAELVGVDAHSVTEHMTQTPLGGARDYRYLTESLGPWVPDRPARGLMNPARSVQTPRSVGAFIVIVFALLLLVAGVLVASGWFNEHWGSVKPPGDVAAGPVPDSTVAGPPQARPRETTGRSDGTTFSVPNSGALTAPAAGKTPPPKALPVEEPPPKPRR